MLWASDFTYAATWKGFAYVAFVVDAYARKIVGWRVSTSAHAGFVLDTLEQAVHEPRPTKAMGLVHHSDGGTNTCRSNTHSGWEKLVSSPLSPPSSLGPFMAELAQLPRPVMGPGTGGVPRRPSETVATMPWPRGSTACSKPRSFTAEVIHRRGPWRNFEAVEYATPEWVGLFNNRRLLEPIGNIPPAEAEAEFCAAQETEDIAK